MVQRERMARRALLAVGRDDPDVAERARGAFEAFETAGEDPVVVVSNMPPGPRENYRVPMPLAGNWVERLNTDAGWYGGTNKGNQGKVVARASDVEGLGPYADLYLPPMCTLFLKYDPA